MLKAGIIYQPEQGVTLGIFRNYVSEATDITIQNPNRQPYNPDAEGIFTLDDKIKR